MSPRGLIAEFGDADALLAAARRARRAGYRRMDAMSPFAVEGLDEALELAPTRLRLVMLAGALAGGLAGFGMQTWSAVFDYPFNVGGRPLFSWPSFTLVTFELAVIGAAVFGFVALLVRCGLPRLHHPLFAVEGIERATQDRFFLVIDGDDPAFDPGDTRRFLEGLKPLSLREVPA